MIIKITPLKNNVIIKNNKSKKELWLPIIILNIITLATTHHKRLNKK